MLHTSTIVLATISLCVASTLGAPIIGSFSDLDAREDTELFARADIHAPTRRDFNDDEGLFARDPNDLSQVPPDALQGQPLLPQGQSPLPQGQPPLPQGQPPLPQGQPPLPLGQSPVPAKPHGPSHHNRKRRSGRSRHNSISSPLPPAPVGVDPAGYSAVTGGAGLRRRSIDIPAPTRRDFNDDEGLFVRDPNDLSQVPPDALQAQPPPVSQAQLPPVPQAHSHDQNHHHHHGPHHHSGHRHSNSISSPLPPASPVANSGVDPSASFGAVPGGAGLPGTSSTSVRRRSIDEEYLFGREIDELD